MSDRYIGIEGALLAIYAIYTSAVYGYAFTVCGAPSASDSEAVIAGTVFDGFVSIVSKAIASLQVQVVNVKLGVTIATVVHLISIYLWFYMIVNLSVRGYKLRLSRIICSTAFIAFTCLWFTEYFSDAIIKYYFIMTIFGFFWTVLRYTKDVYLPRF